MPRERREDRVVRCRRGRRAILRIERGREDAGAALVDHAFDRRGDAWMAVAHRIMNGDVRKRLEAPRPGAARSPQRRAFVGPDLAVRLGGFLRTRAQDDAVKDGFHAIAGSRSLAVAQELGEIAADRAASGASGVPRLISRTPTFEAGSAGWSAGSSCRRHEVERQLAHSLARCRRRSHWRRRAQAAGCRAR